MSKLVHHVVIIFIVLYGINSAAASGQLRVAANALAQIVDSESVVVFRPDGASSETWASKSTNPAVSRSVSKRRVRLDAEGRVIQGPSNVQFITIDLH